MNDLFEKLLEHFLRHFIIRDHAVAQRANRHDVSRRSAQHIAGGGADLQNLAGVLVNGDDGRLAQDDAASLFIDQNIGGSKVDSDVSGQLHIGYHLSLRSLGVASAAQTTFSAPAVLKTRAHSLSVAPVVTISSINRTRFPAKRSA